MFNYWNGLVLGSVQTCFLEVGAYMSLKRATAGLLEGRFCWIWLKISLFLKQKNGGVGHANFIVSLLKWSSLRTSKNIFSRSRCIRVPETIKRRSLRGSFLLTLTENITIFKYKSGGVGPKILLFNYWNGLVLDSVQ